MVTGGKQHLRRVAMYDTAAQVNDFGSVVAYCDTHISFDTYAKKCRSTHQNRRNHVEYPVEHV